MLLSLRMRVRGSLEGAKNDSIHLEDTEQCAVRKCKCLTSSAFMVSLQLPSFQDSFGPLAGASALYPRWNDSGEETSQDKSQANAHEGDARCNE